ncbi:Endonuclease/Exonuclease/phosphatase family protein [Vibrio aerogenes CECT 7868]|uniref:Endonuclease/Exonuclease/phosphatase family protein n=1 Tax=Vibrio aerogenes CECT 7868 TaxID=1216006 RepID=A0A1M6DFW3_9VIBR|nr:endonuclease/exonuclease/phosphatase family protein [Vibrio aerogenes]SHI72070.1 Endonuclease/Exonuclease/phosphatase family protein [Vibrio aerogenes CECT 7868]
MIKRNHFFRQGILAGLIVCTTIATSYAATTAGTFSTLTYNVAGLPQIVSSAESSRKEATGLISCYVNEFDIVNVQEDFNYHAALYDTCNNHPYRSSTSGPAGFGSGLNTMSRFPFSNMRRESWDDCNGVDCLTPKGFTVARVSLAPDVIVDVYNLHAQAQTGEEDLIVRRKNLQQLLTFISWFSAGQPVIVMGDTNTRYTRSGDNIRIFSEAGFQDAWLTLLRDHQPPAAGADALVCIPATTSATCEIVDKILYRNSDKVQLNLVDYMVREDDKNDQGQPLSDHPPVAAWWRYTVTP